MPASKETISLVKTASKAASDKLGENIVALDVTEPFALAEVFLMISATNERQAQAIGDAIEDELLKQKIKGPASAKAGKLAVGFCSILGI